MKKLYIAITLIIISLIAGATIYWKFLSPVGFRYNKKVSDNEYIEIAKQTPEAQKFLEIYPQAKASVSISGLLAVDFRVDKNYGEKDWKYIRLRIFINPRNNKATIKFIDKAIGGSTTIIKKDLLKYIERENL